MPIAGPKPFNTLVAVHATGFGPGFGTFAQNFPGGWVKATLEWQTGFQLIGYDPRHGPPPFRHSTVAVMEHFGIGDDATFYVAIESVSAQFDSAGQWVIKAESVSDIPQNNLLAMTPYASSWILCHEPPATDPPWDDDDPFHKLVPGSDVPLTSSSVDVFEPLARARLKRAR
jgi:hypothetical protein